MFIESGLRYDLLVQEEAGDYFEYLCRHHVGGQMKVAPEHSVNRVLRIMNKPDFQVYEHFVSDSGKCGEKTGKGAVLRQLLHKLSSGGHAQGRRGPCFVPQAADTLATTAGAGLYPIAPHPLGVHLLHGEASSDRGEDARGQVVSRAQDAPVHHSVRPAGPKGPRQISAKKGARPKTAKEGEVIEAVPGVPFLARRRHFFGPRNKLYLEKGSEK